MRLLLLILRLSYLILIVVLALAHLLVNQASVVLAVSASQVKCFALLNAI